MTFSCGSWRDTFIREQHRSNKDASPSGQASPRRCAGSLTVVAYRDKRGNYVRGTCG